MDPISIVGLASAILTFVDFGYKLLSTGKEIYNSSTGTQSVHDQIKSTNKHIKELSDDLLAGPESISADVTKHERAIKELSLKCIKAAEELNSVLDKLSAKQGESFSSVRKAIESVWKEKKIREMNKKLEHYSSQLHLHLTAALTDGQSLILCRIQDLTKPHSDLHIENKNELLEAQKDILAALHHSRKMMDSGVLKIDELTARIDDFLRKRDRFTRENKLLASLHFTKMRSRQKSVGRKHTGTLDWIFSSQHASRCVTFVEWLESESAIFWITGKAGSGKSTLMKFLCEHEQTKTKLIEWAGDRKLVTGTFFFWSAGNDLEKSQEGLLRSLLFEILRQCPELIAKIGSNYFQEEWHPEIEKLSFTIDDLTGLFALVTKQSAAQLKFCFFVDGLDEYKGHSQDITRLLETFSAISNVKFCLSSRPWPPFEEAFGRSGRFMLTVEDHTTADIKLYINEQLGSERRFKQLKSRDPRYEDLVTEIESKANGVFLWVYLVVTELRNSLSNEDTVEEYQQRVRGFPDELEPYFMHILRSIEKTYWQSSSEALLVCLAAEEPLDLLTFHFMFDGQCEPMSMSIQPMSETALKELSRRARIRLKARCLDLLEVVNYETHDVPESDEHGETAGEPIVLEGESWISRFKVDFLHRTVYDFLHQDEVFELIQSRVSKTFNPFTAICLAHLAQLKVHPLERPNDNKSANGIMYSLISYSQKGRARGGDSDKALLKEAERVTRILTKRLPYYSQLGFNLDPFDLPDHRARGSPLLQVAVTQGYTSYLSERLKEEPGLINDIYGENPLLIALRSTRSSQEISSNFKRSVLDADLVDLLIRKGANPIAKTRSRTVWENFLLIVDGGPTIESSEKTTIFRVVSSLVKAGAPLDWGKTPTPKEMAANAHKWYHYRTYRYVRRRPRPEPLAALAKHLGQADLDQIVALRPERRHYLKILYAVLLRWLPSENQVI